MYRMAFIAGLLPLALPALAQEYGRVLSSTPVVHHVAVPQQFCGTQQIVTRAPRTGLGAVAGALAGGAMGHSVGGGSGRALATAIGVVGGAVVGDQIEAGGATQVQNVRQCITQTVYESRTVGYDVVYEYAGQQYSARMAQDPRPEVPLQIAPVGQQAAPSDPARAPQVASGSISSYTTYVPPPPTVYAAPTTINYPAYPAYPARSYPPAGASIHIDYSHHLGR